MGIPVQLVGGGIDWPAWVQAVGSVVAIVAAIIIDRGSARRAERQIEAGRQDALTAHSELVGDWQRAIEDAVELLENLRNGAPRHIQPDFVEKEEWARRVRNMRGAINLYLTGTPPNPRLAWLMVAVHSELDAAGRAIEAFDRTEAGAALTLHLALGSAARVARTCLEEYRGGID